jgi:hypothetical protein
MPTAEEKLHLRRQPHRIHNGKVNHVVNGIQERGTYSCQIPQDLVIAHYISLVHDKRVDYDVQAINGVFQQAAAARDFEHGGQEWQGRLRLFRVTPDDG